MTRACVRGFKKSAYKQFYGLSANVLYLVCLIHTQTLKHVLSVFLDPCWNYFLVSALKLTDISVVLISVSHSGSISQC